jgi:hypothetical protein
VSTKSADLNLALGDAILIFTTLQTLLVGKKKNSLALIRLASGHSNLIFSESH